MKKLLSVLALFSTLSLASPAMAAWDTAMAGKLQKIDISMPASNFGLRLVLEGPKTMCNAGQTWAYLNEADSNYKTFLAAILLAKAQGSTITIFSASENGYCHVEYISVS